MAGDERPGSGAEAGRKRSATSTHVDEGKRCVVTQSRCRPRSYLARSPCREDHREIRAVDRAVGIEVRIACDQLAVGTRAQRSGDHGRAEW